MNNQKEIKITNIDESTRQVAPEDSGDGRWKKGDEVALVQNDYHEGSWAWACVKKSEEPK
ncbi:MAG: hypothetical protein V7L04_13985 [Nostoc sp.]|uniref:hypothetical protein n=1 Tax=Nostoc sp. TaxID=1180 RepID=UPI002FFD0C27